jgi:Fur family ferric uptake transcriptional regulator
MNDQELRDVGLKVTAPRLRVLKVLEGAKKRHLSAEEVYRLLMDGGEDVGLATVYRVLTQFEAAGLVTRLNFEGGRSVFELEQGEHHDHMVCVGCGHVEEFVDEVIERRQAEIAQKKAFLMTDHSLTIYGRCVKCRDEV